MVVLEVRLATGGQRSLQVKTDTEIEETDINRFLNSLVDWQQG